MHAPTSKWADCFCIEYNHSALTKFHRNPFSTFKEDKYGDIRTYLRAKMQI